MLGTYKTTCQPQEILKLRLKYIFEYFFQRGLKNKVGLALFA